jgi:hypothetical protein
LVPPTETPEPATLQARVLINELLPSPSMVDWDGDGIANESDEWIELVNAGDGVMKLGGWSIVSGGRAYVLPKDVVLASGGLLVLFQTQTGIELTDSGGLIQLLDRQEMLHDQSRYPGLSFDASYSRDKLGVWHADWTPSPGRSNSPDGSDWIAREHESTIR